MTFNLTGKCSVIKTCKHDDWYKQNFYSEIEIQIILTKFVEPAKLYVLHQIDTNRPLQTVSYL